MDNIEEIRANYIDPSEFDDELQSWEELWDYELSLYDNYINVIKQFLILPNEDDVLPVISGFLCASPKWAKILPILFCHGMEGSGKSTLANLAVCLRGVNRVFTPTDTFASIRNELNILRYHDPEERDTLRDNTIMAWDNIYASTILSDLNLMRLLLVGYDESGSKISIANSTGGVITFDVFCGKILSSVEAIHAIDELGEFRRRLMLIPHKQISSYNDEQNQGRNLGCLQNRSTFCWKGADKPLERFWQQKENCRLFRNKQAWLNRNIGKPNGGIDLPDHVTSLRWTISRDICATIMVASGNPDPQWAIDKIVNYWSYIDSGTDTVRPMKAHLEFYVEQNVGDLMRQNCVAEAAGLKPIHSLRLDPKALKLFMDRLYTEGKITEVPTVKKFSPIMAELGWILSSKGWIRMR